MNQIALNNIKVNTYINGKEHPKGGGYSIVPLEVISSYDQWRKSIHLSDVEYIIPKSKAIKSINLKNQQN
jgi:hypothetical protein